MTLFFVRRLTMTCSQTLNFYLKQYQKHGLMLRACKDVRQCGRQINKDGVRLNPKNMKTLQTMREPQNGAELIQYFAAVICMRSAIPKYSKRVASLQAALAKVFEGKSRRSKKAAATVSSL
jgi:hypothetical protein